MYGMLEQTFGHKAPNSHHQEMEPISTIFSTPGLLADHVMAYPHWYRLGEHRVFIVELVLAAFLGVIFHRDNSNLSSA